MPHFINVAIGTMRGIIVAKTAGTSLAKYPLPMLDAQAVLHSMMANMQKREQQFNSVQNINHEYLLSIYQMADIFVYGYIMLKFIIVEC